MDYIQNSLFGKTFQELSPQENPKEKTSESSLKNSSKPSIPRLQYLDLRGGHGLLQDISWETVTSTLPGESWTLNGGEYPKDVEESILSSVIEDNVPEKYYLSAKACQGILRRSQNRGKPLPEILRRALEEQAQG